jgi:acetyl/propionyl-CoA carboxylase alpha subunit
VFVREASKIGYPVLLKASAGGGGKGMRIVWKQEEMAQAVQGAKREARDFFGDPRLLLEVCCLCVFFFVSTFPVCFAEFVEVLRVSAPH